MKDKYFEFLKITIQLNNELQIRPLLYGSLGLQKISGFEFYPDDIDILIPEEYLNEQWNSFCEVIEWMDYKLVDLHEHAFFNGKYKIAFASIESLKDFADINLNDIKKVEAKDSFYQILNLAQYLRVYETSYKDSYRKNKNNNKDLLKIEVIRNLLKKS
ncbi:MAG: hypothetical protein ACRC41_03680 [Sarcina sp.]